MNMGACSRSPEPWDITDEHAAALAMRENETKLSRGFRMAKLAH